MKTVHYNRLMSNAYVYLFVRSEFKTFLNCSYVENQRLKVLNSIRIILTNTPVLTITTDRLLFGSEHLSVNKNTRLFDAVF